MITWLKNIFQGPDLQAIAERNAVIIDVRTPAEFKQGHYNKSRNIPLQEIGKQVAQLKKQNRPVITCCRSGSRSGMAARMLRQAGIEAHNGGSWQNVARKLG